VRIIYDSKYLSIKVPSTRSEWIGLILAFGALGAAVKGDTNTAWHMLEVSFLVEIAAALERGES
jgi:hypothetical protein